jgi:NADH-quinone oxidoreductase subunit E
MREEGQDREAAAVIPFIGPAILDPADPFGVAQWMRRMPELPLHPLLSSPAAAVAAVTALGFGLSSHMAGIMFGAMQGAASALQRGAASREPVQEVESTRTSVAPSEPASAEAAETPASGTARKPISAKTPVVSAPKPVDAPVAVPAVRRKSRAAGKPASPDRSRGGDDLKRIAGIGPKLEQVLNGRGIRRFADIAALSEVDAAQLDAEFGLNGRIKRDDWIGQAKALAATRKK